MINAVRRQSIYLVCEDLNFIWDEKDVLVFDELWTSGIGLFEIAAKLQRDPDEVALLVIDRSRNRMIKPRIGGIWGREYFELRNLINVRK